MLKHGDLFDKKYEELLIFYHGFDGYEPYDIPQPLFDEYYKSGQRIGYETEYFKKRGLFTSSAVLFMLNGAEEYKVRLLSAVKSIMREKTWALPAHIKKGDLYAETVIDLFSAETAQSLCEVIALMPSAFDAVLKNEIYNMVYKRIILPFESKRFAWESFRNNWAAVCGGCVGMVYLYMFPERFDAVRSRVVSALDCYISCFGEDGICPEGLLYWNYGFGYYLFFARLLFEYDKTDIIHDRKINAIARFQQNMFMKGSCTVSFSDSDRMLGINLGITCFLKRCFSDITVPAGAKRCDMDNCFRFAPYIRSFLWGDELSADDEIFGEEYFYNAQWYINRQKDFTLAAKCGGNNEPHNHNDVGSFILADKSGQIIADFGAGEYTADYFNDNARYKYFAASSAGHNVPLVNGSGQKNGADFWGRVLKAGDNLFIMDIGGAYRSGCSVIRSIETGEKGVTIRDDGGENMLCERFVSLTEPRIINSGLMVGNWELNALGREFEVKKHEVINHEGSPCTVYTIDYKECHSFEISFSFMGGDKID